MKMYFTRAVGQCEVAVFWNKEGRFSLFHAIFTKNEPSPKNKTTPRTTSMMSTLSRRERGTTTRSLYIMVGKVGRNREVKQSEITR